MPPQVDNWQFDSFELDSVTEGRPLSTLAFALFSRSGLMPRYNISDIKLARWAAPRTPVATRGQVGWAVPLRTHANARTHAHTNIYTYTRTRTHILTCTHAPPHLAACGVPSRYLVAVEDNYRDNPYHNRIHAADVLRTLHCIMTRGGVRQVGACRRRGGGQSGQHLGLLCSRCVRAEVHAAGQHRQRLQGGCTQLSVPVLALVVHHAHRHTQPSPLLA